MACVDTIFVLLTPKGHTQALWTTSNHFQSGYKVTIKNAMSDLKIVSFGALGKVQGLKYFLPIFHPHFFWKQLIHIRGKSAKKDLKKKNIILH